MVYSITKSKKIVFPKLYIRTIKPLNDGEYINSRVRFSMGGSGVSYGEMLRGYLDNSIGSQISYYTRGGNIMFKYSMELRSFISISNNVFITFCRHW